MSATITPTGKGNAGNDFRISGISPEQLGEFDRAFENTKISIVKSRMGEWNDEKEDYEFNGTILVNANRNLQSRLSQIFDRICGRI